MYLRSNQNFQKYNKYVYAFRLQHGGEVFITEGTQQKQQFLEGYNDDTGLQGNGERLLSLLQKFSKKLFNKCRCEKCVGDCGYKAEGPTSRV